MTHGTCALEEDHIYGPVVIPNFLLVKTTYKKETLLFAFDFDLVVF
jgi:hypothetical protein